MAERMIDDVTLRKLMDVWDFDPAKAKACITRLLDRIEKLRVAMNETKHEYQDAAEPILNAALAADDRAQGR